VLFFVSKHFNCFTNSSFYGDFYILAAFLLYLLNKLKKVLKSVNSVAFKLKIALSPFRANILSKQFRLQYFASSEFTGGTSIHPTGSLQSI
jgi:hypothetical protein